MPIINETESTVLGNTIPDPIDDFVAELTRGEGNQSFPLLMKQERRTRVNDRREEQPETPAEREE